MLKSLPKQVAFLYTTVIYIPPSSSDNAPGVSLLAAVGGKEKDDMRDENKNRREIYIY